MKPLFILGCPRSGTTLLQALLNRHPEIAIPPETKLFCHFHDQPQWMKRRCLERISDDLQIDLEDFAPEVKEDTAGLLHIIQTAFIERIGRPNIAFVGEKTPEHTSHIPTIRQLFPQAPLVVVVRSGLDVAESLTRVPWLVCDFSAAAYVWQYYMKHVSTAMEAGIENIHIVRYEELVESPTEVLRSLFQVLGVSPGHEANCLVPNPTLDAFLFPTREASWKGNALLAVNRNITHPPMDRTVKETRRAIAACGDMLKRWDYWDLELNNQELQSSTWDRIVCAKSVLRTLVHIPPSIILAEAQRQAKRMFSPRQRPQSNDKYLDSAFEAK